MVTFAALAWLIGLFPVSLECKKIVDLSDLKWTLSDPSLNISVPGKVPSQAHLDLVAAGKIQDPLYGKNDQKYLWVATGNWTYESGPIKGLDRSRDLTTAVIFDGIDTFADISVCNRRIGSTNNQFRQWTFDISNAVQLCRGNMTMKLDFESAHRAANQAAEAANCSICLGNKVLFPNRQFIRKEQSDFGWDWGPTMLPQGIWKPASIVQFSKASKEIYVKNSMIDTYRKGQLNNLVPDQSQPWVMNISVDYIGSAPPNPKMRIRLTEKGGKIFLDTSLTEIQSKSGQLTGSVMIKKEPQLWWPVRYGEQSLYNVDIEIMDQKENLLAAISKKTGFRTVVLNQTPFSKEEEKLGILAGTKWLFEINGHEIYIKGSNYVPQSSFWPSVTKNQVSRLFKTALAANQNMLRVWASGAYLPDFVYDLADEYGLLLWSEFEFGDAIYPTDDSFIQNVVEEAHYQVRRLNHHPSLALWCGNNEIQLALGLFEDQKALYKPARKQFERLFMDVLLRAVFQNTRSISYLPSSSNNGYISLDHTASKPMVERYKVRPNSSALYSNSDYYNYDVTQAFNESAYPVSRFSVEFGFHSHSPVKTYAANMPAKELWFNSSTIVHRNHHWPMDTEAEFLKNLLDPIPKDTSNMSLAGIAQMAQGAALFYPTSSHGTRRSLFPQQVYATQLFQAEFTRSQIEFYRRGSGRPEHNMGSLYWQLNEIWAAPTWASVAVDGRWKPLHYLAQAAYSPVIVAPYTTEAGTFSVSATSDLWDPVKGTAALTWYDWAGKQLDTPAAWSWRKPLHIGAINSTQLFASPLDKLPRQLRHAVAFLDVNATTARGAAFRSTRAYHPARLSAPGCIKAMRDPGLRLRYDRAKDVFTVRSEAVAAFVWLEEPEGVRGHWSENAFWMLPGEKEVSFVRDGEVPEGWWADVEVLSIWDLTKGARG